MWERKRLYNVILCLSSVNESSLRVHELYKQSLFTVTYLAWPRWRKTKVRRGLLLKNDSEGVSSAWALLRANSRQCSKLVLSPGSVSVIAIPFPLSVRQDIKGCWFQVWTWFRRISNDCRSQGFFSPLYIEKEHWFNGRLKTRFRVEKGSYNVIWES